MHKASFEENEGDSDDNVLPLLDVYPCSTYFADGFCGFFQIWNILKGGIKFVDRNAQKKRTDPTYFLQDCKIQHRYANKDATFCITPCLSLSP